MYQQKGYTITTKKTIVMKTASINCHIKKVRDCYILQAVLLVPVLLLIITIICYYHAKKKVRCKMENNEYKKVCIKNFTCYYFDDIIRVEDLDVNNILIDKKNP